MNRLTASAVGFPPIARRDARVLILGSMPSVASLEKQQYYGHPRNAFWPIMCRLFAGTDVSKLSYAQRKRQVKESKVAVWDVMATCERPGSLDSAINEASIVPNDFVDFFNRHAKIRHVFFNGAKAEQSFRRYVLANVDPLRPKMVYERLPSTSPAMASLSLAEKTQAWKIVAAAVNDES